MNSWGEKNYTTNSCGNYLSIKKMARYSLKKYD